MISLRNQPSAGAWSVAVALLERWLRGRDRLDALMEAPGLKAVGGWHGAERARCQHLLFGAVRHHGRLAAAVDALVPKPPRARLRAVLLVAGFELLEADAAPSESGQTARVVHHAVGQAKGLLSPAEARLVNAVLRKLARAPELHGAMPPAEADAAELARFYSHPEWLVRRWREHFGVAPARRLLEWNQSPPSVCGRWRGPGNAPAWLRAMPWPGFFVIPAGHWEEVERWLAEGVLYLQNPATQLAAELLDPRPGETVLDLCAAPGGKSLLLADLLVARAGHPSAGVSSVPPVAGVAAAGGIVAVDLPDRRRIGRLRENLAKVRAVEISLIQADVRALSPAFLKAQHLPAAYDAVLLDAPCSNTGVIRHRVDVKWRLREADVAKHAAQQLALLTAAAGLVAGTGPGSTGAPSAAAEAGGRLVYSTCSLEPEENEGVIDAFLRASGGRFVLEQTRSTRPWETECDGGSAFLLRRVR